jgi:hypothetical protein
MASFVQRFFVGTGPAAAAPRPGITALIIRDTEGRFMLANERKVDPVSVVDPETKKEYLKDIVTYRPIDWCWIAKENAELREVYSRFDLNPEVFELESIHQIDNDLLYMATYNGKGDRECDFGIDPNPGEINGQVPYWRFTERHVWWDTAIPPEFSVLRCLFSKL